VPGSGGLWSEFYSYTAPSGTFPQKVEIRLRFGNAGTSNTRMSIDNMLVTSAADLICAKSLSSSSTSVALSASPQDFTEPEWVEVDAGGYIVKGIPSDRIIFTNIPLNLSSDGYIYKDFGTGVFGDFTVDFDWQITAWSGFDSFAWGVMFSDSIGNWYDNQLLSDGIAFGFRRSLGSFDGVLHDFATTTASVNSNVSLSTFAYSTITRIGALMTHDIYSDSGRTALLATNSLACTTNTFRYFFPFTVRGIGSLYTFTGQTQNYIISIL
jgi:hypothetical protein